MEHWDLKAGVELAASWAATSYELHSASSEWNSEVSCRVDSELASMNLSAEDWEGDAPFTAFENPRLPSASETRVIAAPRKAALKTPRRTDSVRLFVRQSSPGAHA
jgi:hypothetical protein